LNKRKTHNWSLLRRSTRPLVVGEIENNLIDLQADGGILSTILIGLEK
jgi:hypothetical protein